ncbi:protocadherin alpha-6-like isoform X5 [Nerophis ophidion]|uniref:protocadherin alpha-6-like isoform X5 n=1 Tax=Nerophis ophidion TaxID=159077 RepID=UPI002AE0A310|nr:protocadherin alpha-6-like isoform X5 [Nerophis ophidion]
MTFALTRSSCLCCVYFITQWLIRGIFSCISPLDLVFTRIVFLEWSSDLFFGITMEQRRAIRCLLGFVAAVLLCSETSAQLRYSIPEEVDEGTVVGNAAKDLGLDRNTLKERSRKIDREKECPQSSTCVMNLKTVLENPLEVHYVGVEVMDINDHSPHFSEEETILNISESVLPGARFQLKASQDGDSGQFSVQHYKLSENEYIGLEVKDKGKEGKIPILVVKKSLDRETTEHISLVLTAFDGGKPPKTGEINILIKVLDINDNAPVFSKDVYSVMVDENALIGTAVAQVNATDLDEGPNGDVVYSFGKSTNENLVQLFDINGNTGEIVVKGPIDYEENDIIEIEIQASDKGFVPLTTEKSVIIKIVDINDNAPEIEVTSFSSSIPEDSRPGTTVALISVNDLDSGLNGKVICSIGEDVPFLLSPSLQDKMYSLVTKSPLDREQISKYDILVIARDAGQPALSSEKTISVFISDVNDNSPEFSSSPYTFYVTEGNHAGASVFSVRASDRDENENAAISYHIVRDGREGSKLSSFLSINTENGQISALKSFDFETLKSFQFQVVATDGGSPPLSSNVTVKVFILDQNDNAPVILYPVSSNGSAEGVEEIPRNMKAGDLVTKVRAYDADIGYNGWLLFSLQQVTAHSLFTLDRYTGQIRTLRSFTETDEAEHGLLILVKDNGNVSLSATATVTVKLVEPKEAFAASDVKRAAAKVEEEDHNVTFYLIITLGSVSLLFVISIIVLIAMQCSKSTEYTSKYLQDANYDGTLCHSIQYRSGDKRYMLVGPRMSIGSTIVPGSHANTLVLPDRRHTSTGEPKVPNSDWRYSASLRAGGVMQSSVHMEESSVMQGAQGVLVQNWPTASSAADAEGGEVSPPMGAGVDSNSWHFRYGPGGPGAPPQHLKPGEVPPEAFIIPGSPAIISIRQNQGGEDDKSDFITFGKKEEAKKKKKKKKDKKDKKDKGKDDDE